MVRGMFSALILGLGLAVVASVAQNGSYLLQHAGSRGAPSVDLRRPLITVKGLLRSRVWIAVAIAALAALLALMPVGARRGRLLGAAGGILYGAADATTKAVTMTHGGLVAALTSPWMIVLVLLCVAAFGSFQRGLQIGPAVPVIAVMTGATNAVAIVIGLLVFGEPLGASPAFAATHIAAFALATAAGLALARAQGRLAPGDQPARDSAGAGTRSHRAPARSAMRSSSRRVSGRANSRPEVAAPISAPASTSPG
jgi:hypothetical protein